MRALLFTAGSPFARGVRIVLDELGLDYERRQEITTPSADQRLKATPTLQVPTLWDGTQTLWESGVIVDYLLSTYDHRPVVDTPMAQAPCRPDTEWQDKLIFATVQTFGTAATTISQMKWSGVALKGNAHLERSSEKLTHILDWLEDQLPDVGDGFFPGSLSVQDIFLACHVRFVQNRPLDIDMTLDRTPKIAALLDRLDTRDSFASNPIWWWDPGVIGYQDDGTPIRADTDDA